MVDPGSLSDATEELDDSTTHKGLLGELYNGQAELEEDVTDNLVVVWHVFTELTKVDPRLYSRRLNLQR